MHYLYTHSNMNFPIAFKYAVDKQKSLEIMSDIFDHLQDENDTVHHWDLEEGSYYNSTSNAVVHRHKLAIVEIEYDGFSMGKEISDYYDQLINFENDDESEFSDTRFTWVEINYGSNIYCDEIVLGGYFGTTSLGSDASSILFIYDNTLKCWVAEEGTKDHPSKLDCNGQITILDFSEYFKDDIKIN